MEPLCANLLSDDNRLIVLACYALMIGHPGFVFAPDGSIKGVRGSAEDKSEENGYGRAVVEPSQK